ncbi:hypothetical protein F5884DRAFT_782070 [Xylogone sp. PMI_703]|nr:hypothetical protein F5884DRAFT_782070 [Xylogone sp. PMI_703]
MGRYESGIIWFDDERFIGSEITFQQPHLSSWKLERKIIEHEDLEVEEFASPGCSEARAVFICKSRDGSKEAIMRIRMQIPYTSTLGRTATSRAKQATHGLPPIARMEIKALEALTNAKCSSAPKLLAWKVDKQDWDSWVPGGYLVYVLMEKLPGIIVDDFFGLDRQERDEMRRCLKRAWLECMECGVINIDEGLRNVLWDKENRKCYIIDFEMWKTPTERDAWGDDYYIGWNLAMARGKASLDDMSTWKL